MVSWQVHESDVVVPDGRTVHVFDTAPGGTGPDGTGLRTVVWHHGSPGVGLPPAPLADVSAELGLRWVGLTRPAYAGSDPLPGRDVASVAADVAAAADALGLARFATLGHSGGGAHALATGALLGDRVTATVAVSGMAPPPVAGESTDGFDWYAGFGPGGAAELRAAAAGREALIAHLTTATDEPDFTAGDVEALEGDWAWFLDAVRPAMAGGLDGFVDDDLASTSPWGFDPAALGGGDLATGGRGPVLVLHGADDAVVPAAHSRWVAARIAGADLTVVPGASHITIMRHVADLLRRLP